MNAPIPIAQTFQFCPRCGAAANQSGHNPFRCKACDFVYYFGPVSAVGGIIPDDQGRVLLIRRAKDPGKGQYGLPGGFVDPGESAKIALAREVAEELGIRVKNHSILVSFPNTYNYRGAVLPVLDVFYVCDVDTTNGVHANTDEVTSWEWCRCDEHVLSQMAFESNRKALETYLQ